MQLSELIGHFEKFWPTASAEEWDRVGLLVGSPGLEVDTVLVSVDLTEEVISEAIGIGAQIILTHHPVLLRPINTLAEDELKGRIISKLIKGGLAAFSAHTNADVQADGASNLMAQLFGLGNVNPLVATNSGFGHGAIGSLKTPITLKEFASLVSDRLPKTARKVAFAGNPTQQISTVAICSGAGDGFISEALASPADVYVTSDLRHHPTQDAIATPRSNRNGLALIDVSHWAAESLWVESAATKLDSIPGISAIASNVITDPWTTEVD